MPNQEPISAPGSEAEASERVIQTIPNTHVHQSQNAALIHYGLACGSEFIDNVDSNAGCSQRDRSITTMSRNKKNLSQRCAINQNGSIKNYSNYFLTELTRTNVLN